MKKIIIALFTLSICLASGNIQKQMDDLMRSLQDKYQISGPEDLYKLKTKQAPQYGRTASRDMGDLVGDWRMEEENMELLVTVGSDQSIPDPFSTLGLVEADGSVTATTNDYETDLNYMIVGLFDEDGPDCNMNCEGDYNDYMNEGIDVSDDYCECCHEDYPIDEICDDGGDNLNLEFEGIVDMNYPRAGAGYATDGEFVYAVSGFDTNSYVNDWPNNGERYNPDTDTWGIFVEGLIPRCYTNAEYVNGNIYLFNGYPDTTLIEVINVSTGDVSESESNPYPVVYGGSAVWNDKIYVFGGSNDDGYSNRLYEFDPTDESWTRLADMPDGKQTNGQVVNGILYTLGGYNGSASSHINAYDIEENTWETVGDMSIGISAHSVATDGELIFVIGDYSDIEFCGVYDPFEGEFFELESNMAGRRHSASVFLNGEIYAYGGSQPEGFNGNEDYVILSSAEKGYPEFDWDDDDWSPEAIITNMNLMEFFMLMFGVDPDSLGVENPVVVGSSSTQTESGDIVLDEVFAMLFSDGEMLELEADSGEAVTLTSIDTVTGSATFDNLILYDSTGAAGLTLSGAIGPGMMDFVAGEETVFPFLEGMEDMFEEDDGYEFYMSFYEDSTGMEIEVEYYDDEYYYDEPEIQIDTSYFTWSATSDSLFLYDEDDYYYYEPDTTELAYFIDGDTLAMEASFNPCEDEDSFEECIEFASEEIAGLDELEDIQSLRISMGRVLTPSSFTAVDPGNGFLPQEFNLYANYPNPFNPVTTIRFDVGQNSGNNTLLRIYDITGRSVATLINGQLQTGTYEIQWDARGFSSGIYFSELISGTKRHTQKMVLLK